MPFTSTDKNPTGSRAATVATPPVVHSDATRRFAMLAMALGGFGIGTTEFVAMGLLPNIASSVDVSEPTAGYVVSSYALGVVCLLYTSPSPRDS